MVNVFSFCLYGPENPKYHDGLMENLELIHRYFPDWRVFVYVGADITEERIEKIVAHPQVTLRKTGKLGSLNTIERFFAIDEPNVDIMFVRDADSRIHWKDRWAIHAFLNSKFGCHCIRDHKDHGAYLLAGLWGIRKGILQLPLRHLFESWIPQHFGNGDPQNPYGFGMDQNFLTDVIYPIVIDTLLIHYSFQQVFKGEHNAVAFPFEWSENIYCGRIEQPSFRELPAPRERPLSFLPNPVVKLSR